MAAGSSGMAQAPDTSSTQNGVMVNLDTSQAGGTLFHIESEDGTDILTYAPAKQYNSVVLCSPDLKTGSTYKVFYGGSSTGVNTDGLYSGGTYTAGTESTGFTVSGAVTTVGTVGMTGGNNFDHGSGRTMPGSSSGDGSAAVTPGAMPDGTAGNAMPGGATPGAMPDGAAGKTMPGGVTPAAGAASGTV